jgi:hypothetical protein
MQVAEWRPRLITFRVEAFQSDNRVEDSGSPWSLELQQEIQVGLAVPTDSSGPLQAIVKITLGAQAHSQQAASQTASFKGEYTAKFHYPPGLAETVVAPLLDQEPHQYLLVAQAFPLAMSHFRRELQSTGFDARQLPLGV